MAMYHDGSRELQDRFDSRRIADRLEQITVHDRSATTTAFIERADVLPRHRRRRRLAGLLVQGRPARLRARRRRDTLAFPSYDGNGMFRSLGNVLVNPKVGMLFVDFERPNRMRINGVASLDDDDEPLSSFEGATDRARACGADLPELPPLHPQDADGRALRVLPSPGSRAPGAGLEADGRLPRLPPRSEAITRPVTHVIWPGPEGGSMMEPR
jgi:hypothetical protein